MQIGSVKSFFPLGFAQFFKRTIHKEYWHKLIHKFLSIKTIKLFLRNVDSRLCCLAQGYGQMSPISQLWPQPQRHFEWALHLFFRTLPSRNTAMLLKSNMCGMLIERLSHSVRSQKLLWKVCCRDSSGVHWSTLTCYLRNQGMTWKFKLPSWKSLPFCTCKKIEYKKDFRPKGHEVQTLHRVKTSYQLPESQHSVVAKHGNS